MNRSEEKILQYLGEAHATEQGLMRVLQAQIAMTPRGRYRAALGSHLRQTRSHADRVNTRLGELGGGGNPLRFGVGLLEGAVAQALALASAPLDLLRGSSGEEKVLKNAKDTCANEALEIATYTALERLARAVGDAETAKLAASICADEQKMLDRVLAEIPRLADAVVRSEVEGNDSYEVSKTGAADAARDVGEALKKTARETNAGARRTARQARKLPGVAQAEGQVKGAFASEGDLPIAKYDSLSAAEILERLGALSQIDLAKIDSYERKSGNRTTILSRITSLRGQEPWPGYDELDVGEIRAVLGKGDDTRIKRVRSYERAHKNRAGVLNATTHELSRA